MGRPFKYWVRRAALRLVKRAPEPPIPKWHVVKGDMVEILSGRSAGKTGKVKKVLRRKNRLIVEGLNLVRPLLVAERRRETRDIMVLRCVEHEAA